MVEVEFVVKLLKMPDSIERRVAIYHACKNNKRLRDALVNAGICAVKKSKPVSGMEDHR